MSDNLYIPKAQHKAAIARLQSELRTYKCGFESAMKWLLSYVAEDASNDTTKDKTFTDEYKTDLAEIRAARRLLKKEGKS